MMRVYPILGASLLAGSLEVLLPARVPAPDAQESSDQARPDDGNVDKDAILATWLWVEHEHALALARIALQRASNHGIRRFAQSMLDDSQPFVQQLQRTCDANAATGIHGSGAFDHQRSIRELGRQALDSAIAMLQQQRGAEFDLGYIGMQVGARAKVADMLDVFQRYASPALRATLVEGQRIVQAQLQQAKAIAEQLERNTTERDERA